MTNSFGKHPLAEKICSILRFTHCLSQRFIYAGILGLIMLLANEASYAEGCHPVQLSLVTPVQVVPKEDAVCGVRFDLLWGDNKAVWGLDAGLTNGAGGLKGIEVGGLVNVLKGPKDAPSTQSWGLQAAGLVNSNTKAPFIGFQMAGLVNDHDNGTFTGIQVAGLANDNDKSSFGGVQVALFSNQNFQSEVTGIQLSLFNQAQKLNGLQIGLANGVSAAEGVFGLVMIPLDILVSLSLGHNPDPVHQLISDPKARQDAAVNGVQVGLITNLTKSLKGFQISPFFNLAEQSMNGGQVSLLLNSAGDTQDFQAAVISNVVQRNMDGLQVGMVNVAGQDVTGVQIGIINICKNLKGVQIGAVNVVWGRFPNSVFFAPLINMGF